MLNYWFLLIYTITKQSAYKLHKAINTVDNTPVDNIDSKQTYCYNRIYKIQHSVVYKAKPLISLYQESNQFTLVFTIINI